MTKESSRDQQHLAAEMEAALEAAKGPNTKLRIERQQSSETESEVTVLAVTFDETSGAKSISLNQLEQKLTSMMTLGAIELRGAPHHQAIIQGAAGYQQAKIVIQL